MRRQAASVLLLSLILFVSGCGGDAKAPFDATVTGPEDDDFTVTGAAAPSIVLPLEFQVRDASGTVALPDVEIELFAGGGGILTDIDGNPLDPNNPTYFKTKTDDRGLTRTAFLISLPGCGAESVVMTGSVTATVGSTAALWTGTFTIEEC